MNTGRVEILWADELDTTGGASTTLDCFTRWLQPENRLGNLVITCPASHRAGMQERATTNSPTKSSMPSTPESP